MSLQISETTVEEIRHLLEYRNVIAAIRAYREATGCGLKEGRDAVYLLREQFQNEDPARFGAIPVSGRATGSWWTLIVALAVFLTVLGTIYAYIFPRLAGEKVSATAPLEVREVDRQADEHSTSMKCVDGQTWNVAERVLLTARDFSSFRGFIGNDGVALLKLNLSTAGRVQIQALKNESRDITLGVIIHNRLVSSTSLAEWTEDGVTLSLKGMSSSDSNEVFARLTN